MPPSIRRAKPDCVGYTPFAVRNIEDGETVHQACLLINGQCHSFSCSSEEDFVSVKCSDGFTEASEAQHWPVAKGTWKALALLSPGPNYLDFELHHAGGVSGDHRIIVNYTPLLQLPPLHLAIMVAKDSPLLIDCPPAKQAAISSAHSSLDAAIAKFRTTAYMWQALTAEDMRLKGLGRCSFRLDEEWSVDTTSQKAFQQFPNAFAKTGTVPRIHIVRTEKTVAELRDTNYAQQNSSARDAQALHGFFEDALKAYGGPFASNNHPVVAGMILDSAYSIENDLIHAHAALGCHNPNGLSLGMFGSHLAYSWPRFLEEIPACLLDSTAAGDTVGNDNGECDSLRQACFVGQGAFLHEVGHAFGADHTTGIMARGYSKHWGRNFLGHFEKENDAKWNLQDALRFRVMPHFRLPGDEPMSKSVAQASVDVQPMLCEDSEGLSVTCAAGLARIEINNGGEPKRTELMDWKAPVTSFSISNIDEQHDRSKPLSITVLGMNGKQRIVKDVWRLLKQTSLIRIPGHDFMLRKQSVQSEDLERVDEDGFHEWALLLQEKGADGKLYRATAIDLRVGCWMDGAVVYYADGHRTNCGKPRQQSYGGHASEKQSLPEGSSIVKVEIRKKQSGSGHLEGIRMTLDNGDRWGELHDFDSEDHHERGAETHVLEPRQDERVVGFFGQSERDSGDCYGFGIFTAPKEKELPEVVYEMRELRNVEDGVVS